MPPCQELRAMLGIRGAGVCESVDKEPAQCSLLALMRLTVM